MRLCAIGVGQAGGRIADLLLDYRTWKWSDHGNVIPIALAVNTAKADLLGLKTISKKKRILTGQTWVKGHGTGTNNELGARIMQEEVQNINRALSGLGTHHVDAFLVIAGLGGGTGSGGAPVLVRHLKNAYEDPVYALGILPAEDEGKLMTFNAARSLLALQQSADSVIVFDNESWKREGTSLAESYLNMNLNIVKPLGYLLGAGEFKQAYKKESKIGIKVVDAGDIINTLGGFSVLGYAEREAEGGFSLFNDKDSMDRLDTSTLCYSIIKGATSPENLTARCNIKDVQKGLMLISGPPEQLDREGIERARKYLEDAVWGTELRGGDYPIPGAKRIVGVVLLSGIMLIPRVKEILEQGVSIQKEVETNSKRKMDLNGIAKYEKMLKPLIKTRTRKKKK